MQSLAIFKNELMGGYSVRLQNTPDEHIILGVYPEKKAREIAVGIAQTLNCAANEVIKGVGFVNFYMPKI